MLVQGSIGSLNFFWKDNLISSHPLGKIKGHGHRGLSWYVTKSNDFVVGAMSEGRSFQQVKEVCLYFVHMFADRRERKLKTSVEDHFIFIMSLLFLIKIKFYDFDDYVLICDRKRPRREHFG